MKNILDDDTKMDQQEYSGLTISELEKKLITEEPESVIKNVLHSVMRWERLLIVSILVAALIFVACYINNLKKEIYELRGELNERPSSTYQAENIEQEQPVEKVPPDSSQEENDGQVQPVEESSHDSQPEENEDQEQPIEEYTPDPSQGEVDGQGWSAGENPAE